MARSTNVMSSVKKKVVLAMSGGVDSSVAAVLLQAGAHPKFKIVGIPDEYTVTGAQSDIFRHYGINMEGLAKTASELHSRA